MTRGLESYYDYQDRARDGIRRLNAQEPTVIDATGISEEPAVAYVEDTPMDVALEWIGAVLIVLFVITGTLLGCLIYPFIWLCIKSKLRAVNAMNRG